VHGRRDDGGGSGDDHRGAMTAAAAVNAVAVAQLCAGARRRKPAQGPRVDLRWARLLRVAVVSRALRVVRDQLLACSSCGGGGGPGGGRGGRYRRLGPPALAPVDRGDACVPAGADDADDAAADDAENVVSLKVSLLGDCQIGKTSFMVILPPFLLRAFSSSLIAMSNRHRYYRRLNLIIRMRCTLHPRRLFFVLSLLLLTWPTASPCNFDGGLGLVWWYAHVLGLPP